MAWRDDGLRRISITGISAGDNLQATFDTVAAYRAAAGIPAEAVSILIRGYISANDGSGDVFVVDRSDTSTSDDGGYSTLVNGDGLRIKRREINPTNPKVLGAIGDGNSHPLSTVYSSLTAAQAVFPRATSLSEEIDGHAIQRLLDLVDVCTVPKGAYLCSLSIEITRRQHLRGDGASVDGTVLKFFSTNGIVIKGGSTTTRTGDYQREDISIFDFYLLGNSLGANTNGIKQGDDTNNTLLFQTEIARIHVSGFTQDGIQIGEGLNDVFNTNISRCIVIDAGRYGIYHNGGNTNRLSDCYVKQAGSAAYRILNDLLMVSCNGMDTPGRWLHFASPGRLSRLLMLGCNLEDYNDYAIYCEGGLINGFNLTFTPHPSNTNPHVLLAPTYADYPSQFPGMRYFSPDSNIFFDQQRQPLPSTGYPASTAEVNVGAIITGDEVEALTYGFRIPRYDKQSVSIQRFFASELYYGRIASLLGSVSISGTSFSVDSISNSTFTAVVVAAAGTSISTITGGEATSNQIDQMVLTLEFQDANATFVHTTGRTANTIFLKGEASRTMPTGSVLRLMRTTNGHWEEI